MWLPTVSRKILEAPGEVNLGVKVRRVELPARHPARRPVHAYGAKHGVP